MLTECHEKTLKFLKCPKFKLNSIKYWGLGVFSANFSDFTNFIRKIPDSRDENSPNPHNPNNVEKFLIIFENS
jgi:hypothetical protein